MSKGHVLGILLACLPGCVSPNHVLDACVLPQVSLYGDICAEDSSGYEEMSPSEAHFYGVKCAVESIQGCM